MGVTIREKPPRSGIYWLFVSHRGKRTSRKIGTNRKRAEELAEEIRHQLALDKLGLTVIRSERIRFLDYARTWLEYVRQVRSRLTYTRYKGILEQHIGPLLGGLELTEISRRDIRDALLKYMRTGASKSSVGLMHCVISGVLNHAVDDELIQANPARGLVRKLDIGRQGRAEDIRPLSPDESAAVLAVIAVRWPGYYPAFLTLFRTGMRLGEALALTWDDINFRDRYISVHRTAKDQTITDRTKTAAGRRRVDMSDQLTAVLRDHHKAWMKNNLKSGNKKINLVFQVNNKLLPQNTMRRIFARALAGTGIDHRRVHDIRHTYAATLLAQGTPIVYVKEQLGHSSIKMTVDIYGRLIPSSNRAAVNILDDHKKTGYKTSSRNG